MKSTIKKADIVYVGRQKIVKYGLPIVVFLLIIANFLTLKKYEKSLTDRFELFSLKAYNWIIKKQKPNPIYGN